jgi:hypothetical protein
LFPQSKTLKTLQELIQQDYRLTFNNDNRTYEEFNQLAKLLKCNASYTYGKGQFIRDYHDFPYHVFLKDRATRCESLTNIKGKSLYVKLTYTPEW